MMIHSINSVQKYDEHCRLRCHEERFPSQYLQTSRYSKLIHHRLEHSFQCMPISPWAQGQTQNHWHFWISGSFCMCRTSTRLITRSPRWLGLPTISGFNFKNRIIQFIVGHAECSQAETQFWWLHTFVGSAEHRQEVKWPSWEFAFPGRERKDWRTMTNWKIHPQTWIIKEKKSSLRLLSCSHVHATMRRVTFGVSGNLRINDRGHDFKHEFFFSHDANHNSTDAHYFASVLTSQQIFPDMIK